MDKREENLLKLKKMVEEKSKKFWSEYMDEESMPNDLLDMAIDLIHYQEGLIKNLEAKERLELKKLYTELQEEQKSYGDFAENYTNGYKIGHINSQIELLERLLDIDTGLRSEDK